MALPVWGNLEKSQVDSEKIEEAIARLIQTHEDDPNAHVETGESLYSHKAAEIIDHIVNSIIADKIKDGEIITPKIKDEAVETGKIKDLAVTTAKIGNLAVEEAKIGSLAVTEAKIGSLAVTEAKIGSLAVAEAKIKALAVTTLKIGNLAVTEGKIGSQAVATDKLKNLAVTNAKIANATIETAKIKDLQVTGAKIATATIGDAKITDLTVEKLTGTYLTGKTVRTAASGKRVEMRGANNDLAFYDTGGNLGGIILGQSGKIYISGAGLSVECALSMEAELIVDTTRDVIPTSNYAYNLGSTNYGWRRLILATNGLIKRGADIHLRLEAANLKCYRHLVTSALNLNLGSAGEYWNEVHYHALVAHTPEVLIGGLSLLATIQKGVDGKIDLEKLSPNFRHKESGILMDNLIMANVSAIKELNQRLKKLE